MYMNANTTKITVVKLQGQGTYRLGEKVNARAGFTSSSAALSAANQPRSSSAAHVQTIASSYLGNTSIRPKVTVRSGGTTLNKRRTGTTITIRAGSSLALNCQLLEYTRVARNLAPPPSTVWKKEGRRVQL